MILRVWRNLLIKTFNLIYGPSRKYSVYVVYLSQNLMSILKGFAVAL